MTEAVKDRNPQGWVTLSIVADWVDFQDPAARQKLTDATHPRVIAMLAQRGRKLAPGYDYSLAPVTLAKPPEGVAWLVKVKARTVPLVTP